MTTKVDSILTNLGLTEIQSQIFLLLYKYGPKPASTIAKTIGFERTNTYKTLQVLINKGIIAETTKGTVKQFYVPSKDVFRNIVNNQKEEIQKMEQELPLLETELSKLETGRISPIPKMRFFEGKTGIEALFEDMYGFVKEKQYLVIKMFGSNTLESQSTSDKKLDDYAKSFLAKIARIGISIDAYLGNGILLLENIIQTTNTEEIKDLPAGNSAINVFVVGNTLYLIIFKNTIFGLKIESEELSDMMCFLLKQTVKTQSS